MIRAAGELSEYSKHGVSFRLPGNFNAPKRIMRLFQEAGGYSGKVMLCNVESKTIFLFPVRSPMEVSIVFVIEFETRQLGYVRD